jgi:hypothetical protein
MSRRYELKISIALKVSKNFGRGNMSDLDAFRHHLSD